ncbi:uncharacterized protein LOC113215663 [Frankliniella occidentalis]|uniref:Uncharacterized protein LOC113215663 n=1 Tax=Frankliniella occidentalis TaxID=133901 RepID=A0A6J1TJU8_FRAOC|nr:uncharacterized protein LOC113215663 [Frankliniella occidentalis]
MEVHQRPARLLQLAAVALAALAALLHIAAAEKYQAPYFIHQCQRSDPELNKCLQFAANTLVRHFRSGIPELEVTEVEPIQIEEIHLALGSGPDGYRAIFREVEAFGVSNMTVSGVRSNLDSMEFQFSFYIPHIRARAQYRSSGVLIMVQASGGGDYWGEYEGVRAKVYFKARKEEANDLTYLQVDDIKMDFSVKDIKMGIKSQQDNAIIEAALNLFINTNGQELLKEMKPSIKKHLLVTMRTFINNLFGRVPYEYWILEDDK